MKFRLFHKKTPPPETQEEKAKREQEEEKKKLLELYGGTVIRPGVAGKKQRETGRGLGFDPDYFISSLTKLVAAVLAVALVFYFGYHLFATFSTGISTSEVYVVNGVASCAAKGIIVRDESVLKTSAQGYLHSDFKDGDRVSKGETVCRVYAADMSADSAELERLDREITLLKNSIGTGVTAAGMLESYRDASDTYASFMSDLSAGDAGAASEYSDSFRQTLNRLKYFSEGGDSLTSRLLALQSRRDSLAASFSKSVAGVKTQTAGYYYSVADGYENVMTEASLTGFSEEVFKGLKNAVPEDVSGSAGKIAPSSKWYLALESEGYLLENIELGDSVELTFTDCGGKKLSMTVESTVRTSDGILLLLSSGKEIPSPECGRFRTVEVKASEYSGYRIPTVALHSYRGMTGVFTLHGKYVAFRRVNIIYEDTGYCVVSDYSEFSADEPTVCRVLPYSVRGVIDNNSAMREFAHDNGLYSRARYVDKGDTAYAVTMLRKYSGVPVEYGRDFEYFYYLNRLETLIISGNDLYDGKVVD